MNKTYLIIMSDQNAFLTSYLVFDDGEAGTWSFDKTKAKRFPNLEYALDILANTYYDKVLANNVIVGVQCVEE